MATIIDKKGKTLTETITGTAALYVVGPAGDRTAYGGDVQGFYVLNGTTTYRWVHDERRPAGSGPRLSYAAK